MPIKTSTQPRNNNLYDAQKIMSCFEHQYLFRHDFSESSDFDYLIQQELPCFKIEVVKGNICLRVSHYLATIALPSGIMLEILPKVNEINSECHDSEEIVATRQWVASMIKDISEDNLLQNIPTITFGQSNRGELGNEWNSKLLFPPLETDQDSQPHSENENLAFNSYTSNEPWHYSLLIRAQTKIQRAAELIPKKYQTEINNQPRSQGKLKLSAQLKNNWHRPHYLYSEQSIFTLDQLLSRFLITGWRQLNLLISGKSLKVPQGIQSSTALPSHLWQSVYRDIQHNKKIGLSQFSPAQRDALNNGIEWCWWLLTHSLNINARNEVLRERFHSHIVPTTGLMINMNHAFERWILGRLNVYVNKSLPNHRLSIHPSLDWLISCPQDDFNIENERHLYNPAKYDSDHSISEDINFLAEKFDPDLSHKSSNLRNKDADSMTSYQEEVIQKLIPDAFISDSEGKVTHVIDIKYKNIKTVTQISSSDWQQLFVYQQYLKCQHAWLIFPKTKNFNQRLDVFNVLNENRTSKEADFKEASSKDASSKETSLETEFKIDKVNKAKADPNLLHEVSPNQENNPQSMSVIPFDLQKADLLV